MADSGNNPTRRRRFAFRKRGRKVADHQTGDLQSDEPVTIADGAVLVGDVTAPTIRVAGLLRGTAVAQELILQSTGQIWGDVFANSLQIEPGGIIQGWISSPRDDATATEKAPQTDDTDAKTSSRPAAQLDTLHRLQIEAGEALAARAELEQQFDARLTEQVGETFDRAEMLAREVTETQTKINDLQQRLDAALATLETQENQIDEQEATLALAHKLGERHEEQFGSVNAEKEQLSQSFTTLQNAKDDADIALVETQRVVDEKNDRIEMLETTLQSSIQRTVEQEDALIHWQELAETTQSQLEELEKESATLQQQVEESAEATGKLREKNNRLEFEWQQTLDELNDLRNRTPDSTVEEMQFALSNLQQKNATLKNVIAEAEEKALWRKANLETAQSALEQSRKVAGQQEIFLAQLQDELEEKETAVAKWQTAVEQMAARLHEQEQRYNALKANIPAESERIKAETASLKESLRRKSLQVDAHEAEIDHHLQQMAAQGQLLADIRATLVERELQLNKANSRISRQADVLKRMKQVTGARIQELEAKLARAQQQSPERAAK
ncbi:MAG: hypothetical protein GY803_08630 [Chloroflexi bacterium]|nr:hypothetical protein [Chloroflexota bacterium]